MDRIKRTTLLILAVLVVITMMPVPAFAEDTAGGSVAIDAAHFPDEVFQSYIKYHFDTDKNGVLSKEEIEAVESMDINNYDDNINFTALSSLDGLKYFTNLKDISIYDGENTNIHYIDFTANKSLERIYCCSFYDSAIDLNIKGLDKLKTLNFYYNYDASQIDITGCTNLIKAVQGTRKQGHTDRVLRYQYVFETGHSYSPYDAYDIEIDGWIAIVADGQKYISEGIPINKEYFPDPEFRHFLRNEIVEIQSGGFQSLDANLDGCLSEGEIALYTHCDLPGINDDIKSVKGIEYFTNIEYLDADSINDFYLEELDLHTLTKLKTLYIRDQSNLKSLDVTGCTELERIDAKNSGIRELDLRNNTNLNYVDLSNDPGIVINMAGNDKLISAVVYTNDKSSGHLTGENYHYICEFPVSLNFYVSKDHEFLFKRTKHIIGTTFKDNKLIMNFQLKKQTYKNTSYSIYSETNAKVNYKSGNPKKISINKKTGKITVKAAYVGKATITVTALANEAHSAATTKFMVYVLPDPPGLKPVANTSKGKIKVKWKKSRSTKCTGYKIQYSTSKMFKKAATKTKTVKGIKNASKVISKLKKGKTYYVRMRTYLVYGGETYYSQWTPVKTVKIKK